RSQKGRLVTGQDLRNYKKTFRAYSVIYPIVYMLTKLDTLLFWCSGYTLIVRSTTNKKQKVTDSLRAVPCQVGEMK
ncbi:MAG: hypothetical protein ACREIQ_04880, partial [Nitrospiria bacterium]